MQMDEYGCCKVPPPPSPILINTDGSGFELSAPEDGVVFDFFGDGKPVKISWTLPGTTNGWLVLDRNGNGQIDNAMEMFGNLTAQPSSPSPNGFLALAEFDKLENGGNNDGMIDIKDAVYQRLRLWIDKNHNGVTEPEELITLASAGLKSIDLKYHPSKYVDVYGNQYRYRAKVRIKGSGPNKQWAFDVILKIAPRSPLNGSNSVDFNDILGDRRIDGIGRR